MNVLQAAIDAPADEREQSVDVVATMGCSTLELDAENVDVRDWPLDDPHGQYLDTIHEIRDDIEQRVKALFDEFYPDEP